MRLSRNARGTDSSSAGDPYMVVSSVMRRRSHFLRCDAKESEMKVEGGCMIENADASNECVCSMSR